MSTSTPRYLFSKTHCRSRLMLSMDRLREEVRSTFRRRRRATVRVLHVDPAEVVLVGVCGRRQRTAKAALLWLRERQRLQDLVDDCGRVCEWTYSWRCSQAVERGVCVHRRWTFYPILEHISDSAVADDVCWTASAVDLVHTQHTRLATGLRRSLFVVVPQPPSSGRCVPHVLRLLRRSELHQSRRHPNPTLNLAVGRQRASASPRSIRWRTGTETAAGEGPRCARILCRLDNFERPLMSETRSRRESWRLHSRRTALSNVDRSRWWSAAAMSMMSTAYKDWTAFQTRRNPPWP